MWEMTFTLFALVLIIWFWWRKRTLSLFKRFNIPGPTPEFFFGNSSEIASKGERQCYTEWMQKYGKVFGYYRGLDPILVVTDLDIIDNILVKKFQNYSSRPALRDIAAVSENFRKHSLLTVNGREWKSLRKIITPMFSSLKLKMMLPIMQQTAEELVDAVERESSKQRPFNIHLLYKKLTMDTIARTALGVHTRAQEDAEDPFPKCLASVVSHRSLNLKMFACSFPELWCVFSVIWRIICRWRTGGKYQTELEQIVLASVRFRKEDPKNRRKDLLQLLIDGRKMEDTVDRSELTNGKYENNVPNGKENDDISKGIELSNEEIVQNALTMLFAGFETTSTGIGCITHLLAHNQDIQDEVREEIKSVLSENEEISYETIQKMQILEQTMLETLRLLPPATSLITRQGNEDMEIQGKIIPKEARIHIPAYHIHHDPELWEEPEKFNPHRWTPEEKTKYHAMANQTFSTGPRNCPGKRFANLVTKLALIKLLKRYKFFPAPGTKQEDLKFIKLVGLIQPKNGVMVEVQKI